MEVVPQVSLELHLRGNPPALETIKYSNSANRSDVASGLQQRSLNKAVATALTLFAAHSSCQRLILFRIHSQDTKPSFVRAILSAKHEARGRSQIRDLAHGLFFQLFLKPTGAGHYLDIDLTRLQPDSVKIILDGRLVDEQTPGWSLRTLPSLVSCLPSPTQPKAKPCLRGSISIVSRMPQQCPIMSPFSVWNWKIGSNSCRC